MIQQQNWNSRNAKTLCKILAHTGIKRNKRADKAAKEAKYSNTTQTLKLKFSKSKKCQMSEKIDDLQKY